MWINNDRTAIHTLALWLIAVSVARIAMASVGILTDMMDKSVGVDQIVIENAGLDRRYI